jgi:hypothetical protein
MTTMITAAAAMAMLVSVATPPVGEGEIGAEINLYLELECLQPTSICGEQDRPPASR